MHTNITECSIPGGLAQRRAWIRSQLLLRGYTLASLARKRGLSRNAVGKALIKPYPKMERLIAKVIGVPAWQIWPERYGDNGKPNRRVGRPPKIGAPLSGAAA